MAIQDLGLAVLSIVNGLIVDKKGYFVLALSMVAWLCGQYCHLVCIIHSDRSIS